jgi:hypothetical protein
MISILRHKHIFPVQDFAEAAAPYKKKPQLYKHTNCYSYALGLSDHGKGYPGQLSHNPETVARSLPKADITVQHLFNRLTQGDGLIAVTPTDLTDYADRLIMAAFIETGEDDIGEDCHFMRAHSDGTWSHQKGHGGMISDEDGYGFKISNPQQAIMRHHDLFAGYFAVPKAGLSYYTDPYKLDVY